MIEVITYEKELKKRTLTKEIINKKDAKVWVNVTEPSKEEIRQLKDIFNLHKTTTEDILASRVRPNAEQFQNYTLVTLFSLKTENNIIKQNPIIFILGTNFLLTASRQKIDLIEEFSKQKNIVEDSLKQGHDYLFHKILGLIINNYFPQLETIDNELDRLENLALTNPNPNVLARLMKVKRELQNLRKVIYPQREVISNISLGRYSYISEDTKTYFRDLYDHMVILTDILEDYREIITSVMEVNLSVTSNNLNEVMKVLTVIATVLMPLTLIASIYGMNFKFMPELNWKYGYFITLGVMLLVLIITIIFLKKKKWI